MRELLGPQPDLSTLVDAATLPWVPEQEVLDALSLGVADDEATDALARLRGGARVIVAGQQPGVCGGPSLGLAKAAGALALAAALRDRGVDAVAVFWLASEDHDHSEAERLFLPALDRFSVALHHVALRPTGASLDRARVDAEDVGLRQIEQILQATWSGRFDPRILPRPDETLAAASRRVLQLVFGGTGLLVVEPRDLSVAATALRQELMDARGAIQTAIESATTRLEAAGFVPQLDRPTQNWSLFFTDEDGRRRRLATGPAAKALLTRAPHHVSSSVWTRPLVQQACLRPLAQVSGPSEIAYVAQIQGVVESLGLEPIRPWPRPRLVVTDARFRADAEFLGKNPSDLLDEEHPSWKESWPLAPDLSALSDAFRAAYPSLARGEWSQGANFLRSAGPRERHGWRRSLQGYLAAIEREHRRRTKPRRQAQQRLREWQNPRGKPQDRCLSLASLGADDAEDFGRRLIEATTTEPGALITIHRGTQAT
ncbi:MAG: bacillithiol biosynthesis BshC [Planctomycetes bacterium]|nr:bacillithiol biosynthesis BshC [Planctomycetota bacterium]